MASTRSRYRGREHARPSTGGVVAEHATKIYTVAVGAIVVIIGFLALTSVGHVIDAATQHFMLFYAGVFTLIALCASVGLGLVATDRMILNPGHRVFVQAAHRAASFGAVTFLIIHIITEILAQRSHVLDAVIPFLSPFRTFYIGLGTIASDLIILLVITGIMRGRFNSHGKAWRWRAIHYASYVAFVFGVWHGLLAGRPGKPYVDWSYGFVVAFVLIGLAVRVLSNSLRPKENLSAPPVDMSASSAAAPLRAAAMLAQAGGLRGGRRGIGAVSGPQTVLSAPVTAPVLTALPVGSGPVDQAQPYYEPGYEGPPRYLGAPRATGPMPAAGTGPLPQAGSGPLPRLTGPLPRATGPMPRATGPMPAAGTGPLPPYISGPMPRAATGPFLAAEPRPPQSWQGTGPNPRVATGPLPQGGDSHQPGWGTGPYQRPATGSMPAADTGSLPPYISGPMPRATGPMPRVGTGPYPSPATGPMPRGGTGSYPSPAPGPMAPGSGPRSWPGAGQGPRGGDAMPPSARRDDFGGGWPDQSAWPGQGGWPDQSGWQHQGSWPDQGGWADQGGWPDQGGWQHQGSWPDQGGWADQGGWPDQGGRPRGGWYPDEPPWEGGLPEFDPDLKYREPGPGMPGYRGSRDHRYGGDVR